MSRQPAQLQLLAGVLVLLAFLLATASADIPSYTPHRPQTSSCCCCVGVWACLVAACARLCSCCRRPRPASPPAPYRSRVQGP